MMTPESLSSFENRAFDPAKYRIAAFDLDGTIIDHHKPISDRVQGALKALKDSGVITVISTGRDPAQLTEDITRNFNYVVGVSGGLVVKLNPFEILFSHPFPQELAFETAKAVEALGGDSFLYRNGLIMGSPLSFELLLRDHPVQQQQKMLALYHNQRFIDVPSASFGVHLNDSPIYKIQSFYPNPAQDVPKIAEKLAQQHSLEIVRMYTGSVEFSPLGVNKGSSLLDLAAMLGYSGENIIAFGDSENDLAMMKIAGFRVVPENGTPGMRQLADLICPPCGEDGVADAIYSLFFNGSSGV